MMLLEVSALSHVLTLLVQVATPAITLFVMWLAHRLTSAVEKKLGLNLPSEAQDMLDGWVQKGILYAEQKAQTAVDKTQTVTGPAKLEMAVNMVLDLAQQHGVDTMARDKLEKLVESKLMENKLAAPAP